MPLEWPSRKNKRLPITSIQSKNNARKAIVYLYLMRNTSPGPDESSNF